jgi:hypothetical protein
MHSFESLNFYRGVSERYNPVHPSIHMMRNDRKPRDSGLHFHQIADEWFRARFGVQYRSQALHVTSKQLTAQAYAASPAHVMRIMPLSEYRFCWSPNASDLLFAAKKLAAAAPKEIQEHLESLAYREDNLFAAHSSGNEVMLHCERYIVIPGELDLAAAKETSESVILLGKV